jgi:hypothetical protein
MLGLRLREAIIWRSAGFAIHRRSRAGIDAEGRRGLSGVVSESGQRLILAFGQPRHALVTRNEFVELPVECRGTEVSYVHCFKS